MRSMSRLIWTLVSSAVLVLSVACGWRSAVAADDEQQYRCHGKFWSGGVFSPDGRWLAVGGTEPTKEKNLSMGTVSVWDVPANKLVSVQKRHSTVTACVEFSRDGKWLVTSGSDTVFQVWSVHPKPTPKTGLLALAGTLRHYKLQFVRVGPNQFAQVTGGTRLAVAPSGREFASFASFNGAPLRQSIKVWPLPNGVAQSEETEDDSNSDPDAGPGRKPRLTIPMPQYVSTLTYTPDGQSIVVGFSPDVFPERLKLPEVHFFDAQSGALRRKWIVPDDEHFGGKTYGKLEFSPNGKLLLVCFAHLSSLSVWDVETERVIWTSKIENGWRDAKFSSDGKFLALAAHHQEVQLLRLPEYKLVSVGVTPSPFGTNLTFSPDSQSLLVGWDQKTLKQFDVETLVTKKRWGLDQKRFQTVGESRQPLVVP